MLDSNRLRTEQGNIHWALSSVANGSRGRQLTDELRKATGASVAGVLHQALFADCLRVIHCAVAADAQFSEEELDAVYEPIYTIARHYAGVLPDTYGDFEAIDNVTAGEFLVRYGQDDGLFGRMSEEHWPGLKLCRQAAELGEPQSLELYEQMMAWLITSACQIGGVSEDDPRWNERVDELHELRAALARDAVVDAEDVDLRVKAFLSVTGAFAPVQQAASVYDLDPFDVETIHQEARDIFESLVDRATTSRRTDAGRMLLVLGESGTGKTHLLRGLRNRVHQQRRGFVAYAQLHSTSADYSRYLLHHVVDSLSRPYSGPSGERTGLFELANGLPALVSGELATRIERLTDHSWEDPESLAEYVNDLVDGLSEHKELVVFDSDLLRVLLYALYPDQRTTSRVYKYLRCEDMTPHDRRWIGGVAPRLDGDHPRMTICALGRLMFVTQQAALVLMIDQAELAGHEGSSGDSFRRAIDTLQTIVSGVPSAVAVVACLTDLYKDVRPQLNKSTLDRLEKDPPRQALQLNRSYEEVQAIVGRRLAWIFEQEEVLYREDDPVYPIPPSQLEVQTNRRTRDVLDWCNRFQTKCIAAGEILENEESAPVEDFQLVDEELAGVSAKWNDAMHVPGIEVPDDDDAILELVRSAAEICATEQGLSLEKVSSKDGVLRLQLAGSVGRSSLAISVTNRGYQGGGFGNQVDALKRAARGVVPVAVRTVEFPRGEASDRAIGQLIKAGGRSVHLDVSTLRILMAFQQFEAMQADDRLEEWQRYERPISSLPAISKIFDLERLGCASSTAGEVASGLSSAVPMKEKVVPHGPSTKREEMSTTDRKTRLEGSEAKTKGDTKPSAVVLNESSPVSSSSSSEGAPVPIVHVPASPKGPRVEPQEATPVASQPSAEAVEADNVPTENPSSDSALHVGKTTGFIAEPRTIELSALQRHVGVLGSSGSGKTTLALSLIEQALERGVAVIMVDRKGDLAGYARPEWWKSTADPARGQRLAEQIDVRLFTPGMRGGRSLSISVIPNLQSIPEHECDRMVNYCAYALGAMMRLGDGLNDATKKVILAQSISLLARTKRNAGLSELIAVLEERPDALIRTVGRYDDKLFRQLVQALETVRLSEADLFDDKAEPLNAETLIGRKSDGKVPLAIISTKFLGDVERVQSWVAHLVACLNRHLAKAPSSKLQTLFMLDEADLYMPAGTSKPPSKEPLQDLLKRARSAGLGVMLASQSPADFDYRSREQINSWFLGRIADKRSIDKMKPLFEQRPSVGGKLGGLEPGRFVMLQDGGASDLERTPSLLRTEQLYEDELMKLAAEGRARSSKLAGAVRRDSSPEVGKSPPRKPGRPRVSEGREQT
jgi:energy-coupling factor transporter ATP-binding protein EcfA2